MVVRLRVDSHAVELGDKKHRTVSALLGHHGGVGDRDRDRDSGGRPRNARPRDGLGRPLPYGSAGVDRVPEGVVLSPDEAVRQAQRLIDDGCPFHAHEVFEAAWKATGSTHRELWRGLAQLAVGLTHLQRGNAKGAVALLRRAADRIEPYSAEAPYQLDIAGLAGHARRLADQGGAVADADLTPRLRLRS